MDRHCGYCLEITGVMRLVVCGLTTWIIEKRMELKNFDDIDRFRSTWLRAYMFE